MSAPADGEPVGTVAALHRYPVKSMQGMAVEQGTLDASGLAVGDPVTLLPS